MVADGLKKAWVSPMVGARRMWAGRLARRALMFWRVFTKLLDLSITDPERVDRFLRLLTASEKSILPGDLYARVM